jgi:hypothetical protein
MAYVCPLLFTWVAGKGSWCSSKLGSRWQVQHGGCRCRWCPCSCHTCSLLQSWGRTRAGTLINVWELLDTQGFRACMQLFILGRIPVSSVMQLLENYPAIVNAGADSCTLDLCLLVDSIGMWFYCIGFLGGEECYFSKYFSWCLLSRKVELEFHWVFLMTFYVTGCTRIG